MNTTRKPNRVTCNQGNIKNKRILHKILLKFFLIEVVLVYNIICFMYTTLYFDFVYPT